MEVEVKEEREWNDAREHVQQRRRDWHVGKWGVQKKAARVRPLLSRRLTDARAVKKIGGRRKVSSEDRSLQEDGNCRHRSAVVAQCTHEADIRIAPAHSPDLAKFMFRSINTLPTSRPEGASHLINLNVTVKLSRKRR